MAKSAAKPRVRVIDADDERLYDITVNRVVTVANQKFRPCYTYSVKGKLLTDLGDAVETLVTHPSTL